MANADEAGKAVAAEVRAEAVLVLGRAPEDHGRPVGAGPEPARARRTTRRWSRTATSSTSPTSRATTGGSWRARSSSTRRLPRITRAPQFAEHTDEILRELGKTEDEIIQLKIDGAVT